MKRKSTWIAAVSAAVLLIVCLAVPTAVHSGRSAAVTPGTPAQEAGTPGSTVDRVVEMVPEVIDKITGFIEKQDKGGQGADPQQPEDKTGW